MRKHFVAASVAIALCMAAFSGCSVLKVFENDVQVILENEGEYVGTYTVNIFNNAVVPQPSKAGYKFVGWSVKEEWAESVDGYQLLTSNKSVVRYDDIKDYLVEERDSITLYSAYTAIPRHDIVIAWYDKESTSGLNETHMQQFKTNLYSYLSRQSLAPESMDIVIRGYSGDVGTSCSDIMADGDVDIMIGWSSTSNLTGTGGLTEGEDFIENNSGITVGSKPRYAARLTDTDLCKTVYRWIFSEYGEPLPEEPETPAEQTELVIGWYAKTDTSGLSQEIIDAFGAGLNEYLASEGYTSDKLGVIFTSFDGKVADVQNAVTAAGNVDIMIGMKAFAPENVTVIDTQEDIAMGTETGRRIHLLDEGTVSRLVFEWLKTDAARSLFVS